MACYAMMSFNSAEKALESTDEGWAALVGSADVPGAGDCAYAAADVLRKIAQGCEVDEAIGWADGWWERCITGQSPSYDDVLQPGLNQAIAMKPKFRELVAAWDWNISE